MKGLMAKYIFVYIISIYSVFICRPALAGIPLKNYEKVKQLPNFKTYIYGVGTGFENMNLYLTVNKMPSIYCVPDSLVLKEENYFDILEKTIEQNRETNPNVKIELIFLHGLMKTFPCK